MDLKSPTCSRIVLSRSLPQAFQLICRVLILSVVFILVLYFNCTLAFVSIPTKTDMNPVQSINTNDYWTMCHVRFASRYSPSLTDRFLWQATNLSYKYEHAKDVKYMEMHKFLAVPISGTSRKISLAHLELNFGPTPVNKKRWRFKRKEVSRSVSFTFSFKLLMLEKPQLFELVGSLQTNVFLLCSLSLKILRLLNKYMYVRKWSQNLVLKGRALLGRNLSTAEGYTYRIYEEPILSTLNAKLK